MNKSMINTFTGVLLCCLMSVCAIASASASRLERLDIRTQTDITSFLCHLSGVVHYKVFVLHQPERVVIDLDQTSTSIDVRRISFNRTAVRYVRLGHPTATTLRLVFDMVKPVFVRASFWQASTLRIDVKPTLGRAQQPAVAQKTAVNHEPAYTSSNRKPVYISHAPTRSLRDVVVVIDPGHGGKDPGAMGIRRSTEKHVVLAIALQLKRLIDKQPGMRAVLTRNGDYYVGLRERMMIARKYNGDIFVAIHADAFGNHDSHGASVFALSQTGATSEAARWLAEKENYSELGGVNLSSLDDRNGVIRTVLIDLSQTATISASLQMGSQILRGLDRITTLHSQKVEQARFMVLKSPDIPSVLIETGFISNPREEMNLTSPAYQARLTQAIFSGIKGYFWDYPPHGSRIEAMVGANPRFVNNNHAPGRRRSAG